MFTNKDSAITKNTVYALYYIVLLLLTFFLSKPEAVYSSVMRYLYMVAVVGPLFFNRSFVAFALPLFLGISQASFTPLLPTTSVYFLMIAVVLGTSRMDTKPHVLLCFIWILYILCIELLAVNPHLESVIWAATTIFLYSQIESKQDIKKMGVAFCLMTLILSILYLMYFENFSREYTAEGNGDLETSGWINTNVFGGVIGCGVVSSVLLLVLSKEMGINRWQRLIGIGTVVLSIMVLILNASRGALTASLLSSIVLLFSSKIPRRYKLLSILGLAAFVIILYGAGYFELLEFRVMEEDTASTAGGRTDIWGAKFNAFVNLPIYQQIFGIGYDECVNLGIYFDTHNDFVTALCAYGYIGCISFILLIFAPLFVAKRGRQMIVLGLLLFLILECMVLSPIFRGYFIFFVFYLMVIKFAMLSNNSNEYE